MVDRLAGCPRRLEQAPPGKETTRDAAPVNNHSVFTYPAPGRGPSPGPLVYPPASTQPSPRQTGLRGQLRFSAKFIWLRSGKNRLTDSADSAYPGPGPRHDGSRRLPPRVGRPDPGYPTPPPRRTIDTGRPRRPAVVDAQKKPPGRWRRPLRASRSGRAASHWGNRGEGRLTLSRS